jgi:hypothetical protein
MQATPPPDPASAPSTSGRSSSQLVTYDVASFEKLYRVGEGTYGIVCELGHFLDIVLHSTVPLWLPRAPPPPSPDPASRAASGAARGRGPIAQIQSHSCLSSRSQTARVGVPVWP